MSAATLKLIRLECYHPTTAGCLAPTKWVCFEPTLARYLLLCALDSSVVAMDKTYLIEIVGDMRHLWDHGDKNYRNRDLKPNLSDE
jgi:hypothetical protein